MDDNTEYEFDFSEGDVEIGVDNSNASVPDGWYVCKITSAKADKKLNVKLGVPTISVNIGLSIEEGPYAGAYASMYLPLDDPRMYAAKIRKNFFAALGINSDEFVAQIGQNEDRTAAELKGVKGERVGAMLKTSSRDGRDFLQCEFGTVCPVDEVPSNDDDTSDF